MRVDRLSLRQAPRIAAKPSAPRPQVRKEIAVKHRMIVIVAASLAASPALADPAADALSHPRAFERAVDAGDVPV